MSKQNFFKRYFLIIDQIDRKQYSTFEEINSTIQNATAYERFEDEEAVFSKRTFQRDVVEIEYLFGYKICYDKNKRGYYIKPDSKIQNVDLLDAFRKSYAIKFAAGLNNILYLEKPTPKGSEHLTEIVLAIKNKTNIEFDYQKFWEDEFTHRHVEPYALKEFKKRWYVLAKDLNDDKIKTFALDRLTHLITTKKHFEISSQVNVSALFEHSFGIINPTNEIPQEIILSFNSFQGKYIQSLPLHETQEILIDNENELRIKLKLYITHDFIMELLSFGANVKVLHPQILVDKIKDIHKKSVAQYK